MTFDVTSLSVKVVSDGITKATTDLKAFVEVADKAEKANVKLGTSAKGQADTDEKRAKATEAYMAKLQRQVDLLGANTSQTNSYTAAMKGMTALEQNMAAMLGAEVDAYKRLASEQSLAVKANQELDQSYSKLQKEADAYYASQKKIEQGRDIEIHNARQAALAAEAASYKKLQEEADRYFAAQVKAQSAGNMLNMTGQRQQQYKALSDAQAEAMQMNNAFDASLRRQQQTMQNRDIEQHNLSVRQYSQAHAEAIRMNNALDAAQKKSSESMQRHTDIMAEAHTMARGLSGSLGVLWMTYGSILPMLAGVAIGASLKEAVTGFAKVEYQMTFVKALAEDTTHSVKELTTAMHGVAVSLGIDPEQAAKGLRALTQAGLDTTDALSTLPVAFKLATVGELSLESAALAMTGVMNAYGMKVKDLEHIGDVMAKAGAVSAASVDSISVSMKYSAGTAEQYGVSLEKLATTLTLLGKRGITGSSAGVAANNLITEIYSPSSEKAIKAQAALGVKTYVGGVRQSLEDSMESIKAGLAKYDPESQGILLEAMFGKKGGKAFYAVSQGTKAEFADLEKTIADSSGFVAEVYKKNLQTVEGQMMLTKSAITNMFSTIGEESAQPIRAMLTEIRKLAGSERITEMFLGLAQSIKTFVTVILPVAGIAGGVWVAFNTGTTVVAGLAKGIAFLNTTIEAMMALNFTKAIALLNPVLMTAVGVVTLLAGAYFLLRHNKESVHDMHAKDMEQSAETIIAAQKELDIEEKKLALRKQGIRGDAEDAAMKAMVAQENIARMQGQVAKNNFRLQEDGAAGKGSPLANHLNMENKQLTKDIQDATIINDRLKAIENKRKEIHAGVIAEEKRMDAEELARQPQLPKGTLHYDRDGQDTKGLNAEYNAELKRIQGEIDQVGRTLARNKEALQSYVKQGQIGEILMIKQVEAAEISSAQTTIDLLQKKMAAAKTLEDKQAVQQQIANAEIAQVDAVATAISHSTNKQAEYYATLTDANLKTKAREMEASGQYVEAYKALNDAKYDHEKARITSNLDFVQNAADKEILITRLKFLEQERSAGIGSASLREAVASFDALAGAAANLFKGIVADNAGYGIAGIFTAAMNASDEFAARLPKIQEKLAALKAKAEIESAKPEGERNPDAVKAYNEELSKMQGLANHQKTMWAEVGEAISKSLGDAFGNAGKSVAKLGMVTMQYYRTQEKLIEDRNTAVMKVGTSELTFTQKTLAIKKIDADFEKKDSQSKISAFGEMASAAAGFFNTQSQGYRNLMAVSQVFHAAELAMTVAELVPKALGAVLNQGNGDPYTAFGRMAAMATFVAGLGVAVGGMSGHGGDTTAKDRQAAAGTGTIFSDEKAKSESTAKSIEHLDKNSGLGLVHSQLMVNSLHNIEASMVGLSSLVVRGKLNTASVQGSTGAAQNFASSTNGTAMMGGPFAVILDKILGGLASNTLGKVFGAIFGGKVSVQDFGLNVSDVSMGDVYANKLQTSGYTDTKKSGGLFRKDSYGTVSSSVDPAVTQQISLILKGLGDSVKMAATSLGVTGADFEAHMNDFVAKIGKVSFKDLKGDEIQKQFAAIFSAIGDDMAKWAVNGLDKFTQTGEGALETLMRITNDFVQVGDVLSSVGQKFKVFGLEAVQLSEDFINLAGGLGKLTDGTKYLVDNIFTESEKLAPVAASLDAAMAALGFSYVKTIAQFDALIHAQDLNTVSGQQTYVALMNLAPAFKQVVDGAESAQKALYDESSKALGRLEDSINHEKSVAQAAYDAQIAIIKAQRSSAEKSFNDNKTVLNATIKTATEASSALKSLSSSLKQTLDSMYLVTQQAMRRDAAQALITKALDIARSTGVLPKAEDLADALKTVASPADNLFSTFEDYARDMGITTNKISSLKDITDKEAAKQDTVLSVAQKQLLKLEDQYKLTTANFDAQEKAAKDVLDAETTRLDAILDNAKKQLEVANGTYQAVLKLPDALAAFKAALSGMYGSAASASIGGGGGAASGPSVGTMATASPSKFGGTTYLPYNALYTPAPTNPADLASGKIWSEQDMGRAYMAAHTAANNFAFTPIDGSHADGLDYVPKDNYRANLHVGERVKTAKASRDEDSVAEEIRQMRADLNAALLSIAQNTGKAAKTLDKFDHDGMPTTRDYTLA